MNEAIVPAMTLTDQGANMLSRAVAQEELYITRLVMGDGQLANVGGIPGLAALVHERVSVPVVRTARKGRQLTVSGPVVMEADAAAFRWRELGVMARIGTEAERLLGYLYKGESGEMVSSADGMERSIYITLEIDPAAHVEVVLSPRESVEWEQINLPAPAADGSYLQQGPDGVPSWRAPAEVLADIQALPLSGGRVDGVFEVKDYFKVGPDRVYVTRRMMGEEADFSGPVSVGGSLDVGSSIRTKHSVRVGEVLPSGEREGRLDVVGGAAIGGDTTIGRMEGGVSKGSLTVNGQIYAQNSINSRNIYPDQDVTRSIGKAGLRYNTLYTKKVDAAEHILTPKIQAPAETGTLKFTCPSNAPAKPSPNPLPPQWGGTGKSTALTAADVGALPLGGGALTGDLKMKGRKVWFGDSGGSYNSYIDGSNSDYDLTIQAGNYLYMKAPEEIDIVAGSSVSLSGCGIYLSSSDGVYLPADTSVSSTTAQGALLRNIKLGTAAMTAGSTALTTGSIYLQYE